MNMFSVFESYKEKWKTFFRNQSINQRLILWFLIIGLLPLCWAIIIFYEVSKKILIVQATQHLQALVLRQAELLDYYFREKREDAQEFTKAPMAQRAIRTLTTVLDHYSSDSVEYQKAARFFKPFLQHHIIALNYQNLLLTTKDGKILFSVLPFSNIGENLFSLNQYQNLKPIFENTRHELTVNMSSTILSNTNQTFSTFITAPVILDDQLEGIAIVQLEDSSIHQLLATYNNELGLTGILIAAQDKNHLFIFTPLNTPQEQEESQIIYPHSLFGQFIISILADQQPGIVKINYHHQNHLMIGLHFMDTFNWALISTLNQAQLLAPVSQLKHLFWILALSTIIIVILIASRIAHKISSPILNLTHKTNLLATGDLSQRIVITSGDEIGHLGQSFNEMASQLDQLIRHLDDLVAKRTKQLEFQNIKLEQTIQQLKETQNRLISQEKLASLGALTAGIAHEIKNPLNFINNFAELCFQLQTDLKSHIKHIENLLPPNENEEVLTLFNTLQLNISKIYEHGKRADRIVYNMLQHSSGTPGEKTPTDIHTLLDEYISLSYQGMRAKDSTFNVKIEKYYDSSLPLVNLVPQEICRVFLNLLNNAYYAIQEKKKQNRDSQYYPTIQIFTEKHESFATIKIRDNGIGISKDMVPKLFTPFFTTKPTGEGTGLGLSLSYNIVVQGHGGTLTFDSKPSEFAEFTITLPLETNIENIL